MKQVIKHPTLNVMIVVVVMPHSFQLSREAGNVYNVVCMLGSHDFVHEGISQGKNRSLEEDCTLVF